MRANFSAKITLLAQDLTCYWEGMSSCVNGRDYKGASRNPADYHNRVTFDKRIVMNVSCRWDPLAPNCLKQGLNPQPPCGDMKDNRDGRLLISPCFGTLHKHAKQAPAWLTKQVPQASNARWYTATLLYWLVRRPLPAVIALVDETRRQLRLNNSSSCIAVHVRRGTRQQCTHGIPPPLMIWMRLLLQGIRQMTGAAGERWTQ